MRRATQPQQPAEREDAPTNREASLAAMQGRSAGISKKTAATTGRVAQVGGCNARVKAWVQLQGVHVAHKIS